MLRSLKPPLYDQLLRSNSFLQTTNGGTAFDANWKGSFEFIALKPAPQVDLVGHFPLLWRIKDLCIDRGEQVAMCKMAEGPVEKSRDMRLDSKQV